VTVCDPARTLLLRVPSSRVVVRDPRSLQEATALLQTQVRVVCERIQGSHRWAVALRNLAMIAVALATGRRASGVLDLKLVHVDLERHEVRCERERGRAGRVQPMAEWAIDVVRIYIDTARPVLASGEAPWLFLSVEGGRCGSIVIWYLTRNLVARTIAENPDLDELPGKHITWHSLRVSFATLLFSIGCPICSVNELLLHRQLSATARYTPIPVEDLRQVCRLAHPRA
jgi:site-specific recombinase XerD